MQKTKVIIDTNLWISYLISPKYIFLDKLIFYKYITLIFSYELIEELIEVLNRPKLRKYFSKNDIEKLLNIISDFGIIVDTKNEVNVCRDVKDNFLLSLAFEANADYLITGDKDLLVLKRYHNTEIITFQSFSEKYFNKDY